MFRKISGLLVLFAVVFFISGCVDQTDMAETGEMPEDTSEQIDESDNMPPPPPSIDDTEESEDMPPSPPEI